MSKHTRPWRLHVITEAGSSRNVTDDGRDGSLAIYSEFDEIVVGKFLHVEMMDDNNCFVRLGNAVFNVHVTSRGATVTLTEGSVDASGRIEGGRK